MSFFYDFSGKFRKFCILKIILVILWSSFTFSLILQSTRVDGKGAINVFCVFAHSLSNIEFLMEWALKNSILRWRSNSKVFITISETLLRERSGFRWNIWERIPSLWAVRPRIIKIKMFQPQIQVPLTINRNWFEFAIERAFKNTDYGTSLCTQQWLVLKPEPKSSYFLTMLPHLKLSNT